MARQDTVDFLTAFAVGTVLGIGATLLLQPQRTPKERVLRQLKPYRKQMKRSYRDARSAVRHGTSATGEIAGEAIDAGREMLGEFRHEAAQVISDARKELRKILVDEMQQLSKGVKRSRRRMGM